MIHIVKRFDSRGDNHSFLQEDGTWGKKATARKFRNKTKAESELDKEQYVGVRKVEVLPV